MRQCLKPRAFFYESINLNVERGDILERVNGRLAKHLSFDEVVVEFTRYEKVELIFLKDMALTQPAGGNEGNDATGGGGPPKGNAKRNSAAIGLEARLAATDLKHPVQRSMFIQDMGITLETAVAKIENEKCRGGP